MAPVMITTLAAASETASGEENSLLLPHTYDLVWGTISFAIVALVLIKYVLPRFTKVLDERTARIEEGLAIADRAKKDQAGAEQRAARLVEEARREAASIREKAQSEAASIVAAARAEAQGEAGRALDAAQRQILAERQAAQISLRTEVGLLASTLAERIVGEQLKDTELSSRVIDRFLDELEAAPASPGVDGGASVEELR
ncbi:F0F1 ATP synthase subunit B [Actinomyces gaoshouyii]|uniref:ATP synthase subunit b n=1 Tax=Actinomyces gaoshouyii TaxID=1960083 RepID=A0A8H9LL55_9ACTO|nr:F0F1 ATP synthase subunit B [Actinomyces gaoshouyii]ARD42070.1 F0F1 ATP synthase subunit B [Actinomyces gaoshouyii]GGO96692.1 ATP synthase subunit b [Actinomyces gaoshouyii]